MIVQTIIVATFIPQSREPALGAHAIAAQHGIESCVIVGKLRAISGRVPQMNYSGCETSVLSAHARVQQPDQQIRILPAPAAKARVEAVDKLEIGPPYRKIARACAAPPSSCELAQAAKRKSQYG